MSGQQCAGREGKYLPWSWGEVFRCSACGAAVRQAHTVQPLTPGPATYDSICPIPTHEAAR